MKKCLQYIFLIRNHPINNLQISEGFLLEEGGGKDSVYMYRLCLCVVKVNKGIS